MKILDAFIGRVYRIGTALAAYPLQEYDIQKRKWYKGRMSAQSCIERQFHLYSTIF